jgi:ribosomal protein S27E
MDLIQRTQHGEVGAWPGHHCGKYALYYDRPRAQVVCSICGKDVIALHGPQAPMSEKVWWQWVME